MPNAALVELPESAIAEICRLHQVKELSLFGSAARGEMTPESDYGGGSPAPAHDSPAARAEQETEIRQMLGARSDRLVRAGEPALDIDVEVARLLAPAGESKERDPAIVEEVRQLVTARNERRERQGLAPLDVDEEVERTLAELEP